MKRLSFLLLALLLLTASFVVGVPAAHGDVQDQLPLTLIEKEGFTATVTSIDDTAQEDWMLAVGLHFVGSEAGAELVLYQVRVNGWTLGYDDFKTKALYGAYLDKNGMDDTVHILSTVKDSYQISEIDTVEFIFQIRSVEDGRVVTEKGTLTLSESPVEAPVSLRYDARLFFDDWNMTMPICLTYATNRTDIPALMTLAVTAIDAGGEPIPIFDMMRGRTRQVNQFSLCVPAGVEDYPVAFRLPSSYTFDQAANAPMPAIDHLDCEVVSCVAILDEDLANHFTAGEVTVDQHNLRMPLVFDETIANEYSDIYANYTLVGRSGGEIVSIVCSNLSGSWSVQYALDNAQNYLQVYKDAPRETVEEWSFYPGFISGKKR
ncbi:MAG: hypothetical protein IJI97_05505 [Clostridia bacterium]|nr:hypothetical protein [Clostridia bacterium]MBQ6358397.1 hypothetical protein [Clostridia bacterium]MBR0422969.1 hypothetical protein [Clostridia bacterium]